MTIIELEWWWMTAFQSRTVRSKIPCPILYHSLIICIAQPNVWNVMHHDDVIKWKHFPRNWPFVREIHRSPVNFLHKGQWRGALMFTLIYAWINDWVNNREAGDLRRQHGHYDVIVMMLSKSCCSVYGCIPIRYFAFKTIRSRDGIQCWVDGSNICCVDRRSWGPGIHRTWLGRSQSPFVTGTVAL